MCGISGIISFKGSSPILNSAIKSMNHKIRHRGPDGEGFVLFSNNTFTTATGTNFSLSNKHPYSPNKFIGDVTTQSEMVLAHRRLSIIDLSENAHQPMCDETQNYWITYNGEIYNFLDLKKKLQNVGHIFYTNSDTEVVLKSFIEWGEECVNFFNGMWAFVIYNRQNKKLFCSRDRMGVKPFYYILNSNYFAFASEQKALIELEQYNVLKKEINSNEVFNYFVLGKIEFTTESFFKDILELNPSNNLIIDLENSNSTLKKYFNIKLINPIIKSEKDFEDEIKSTFITSVKLRLQSDVPLGACLSGGIDSSSIVAAANYNSPQNFKTFTTSFNDNTYNETEYAKIVAKQTNSELFVSSPNSSNLWNDLNDLIYCQDIPIWSTSTYSQFQLMKLAKEQKIKVLLDGQGGDELFAGYPHHLAHYFQKRKKENTFKSEIKQFSNFNKSELNHYFIKWKILNHWLPKLSVKLKYEVLVRIYPDLIFLNKEFLFSELKNWKATEYDFPNLNEQLKLELDSTLLKSYLKCEDRCSMHFSIESRTPFSDDSDLIKLAMQIPDELKIKNGNLKNIFRESVKTLLPKEILARKDKMGFATPNKLWIQEISNSFLNQIDETEINEFLDLKTIKKQWTKYIHSKVPSSSPRLFKPIAFYTWQKIFK